MRHGLGVRVGGSGDDIGKAFEMQAEESRNCTA